MQAVSAGCPPTCLMRDSQTFGEGYRVMRRTRATFGSGCPRAVTRFLLAPCSASTVKDAAPRADIRAAILQEGLQ